MGGEAETLCPQLGLGGLRRLLCVCVYQCAHTYLCTRVHEHTCVSTAVVRAVHPPCVYTCVHKCGGSLYMCVSVGRMWGARVCVCMHVYTSVCLCVSVSLAASDLWVILLVSWEQLTAPRPGLRSQKALGQPPPHDSRSLSGPQQSCPRRAQPLSSGPCWRLKVVGLSPGPTQTSPTLPQPCARPPPGQPRPLPPQRALCHSPLPLTAWQHLGSPNALASVSPLGLCTCVPSAPETPPTILTRPCLSPSWSLGLC